MSNLNDSLILSAADILGRSLWWHECDCFELCLKTPYGDVHFVHPKQCAVLKLASSPYICGANVDLFFFPPLR